MVRRMTLAVLVATSVAFAAGPIEAAEPGNPALTEAQNRMSSAVNRHFFDHVLRVLPPGDAMRLFLLAQQRAIAMNCDGYAVDEAKFTAVLNDIAAPLRSRVPAGQDNLLVDVVMHGYGVALGGQIAIAAADTAAYCAYAQQVRDGLKNDTAGRVSIWK